MMFRDFYIRPSTQLRHNYDIIGHDFGALIERAEKHIQVRHNYDLMEHDFGALIERAEKECAYRQCSGNKGYLRALAKTFYSSESKFDDFELFEVLKEEFE